MKDRELSDFLHVLVAADDELLGREIEPDVVVPKFSLQVHEIRAHEDADEKVRDRIAVGKFRLEGSDPVDNQVTDSLSIATDAEERYGAPTNVAADLHGRVLLLQSLQERLASPTREVVVPQDFAVVFDLLTAKEMLERCLCLRKRLHVS